MDFKDPYEPCSIKYRPESATQSGLEPSNRASSDSSNKFDSQALSQARAFWQQHQRELVSKSIRFAVKMITEYIHLCPKYHYFRCPKHLRPPFVNHSIFDQETTFGKHFKLTEIELRKWRPPCMKKEAASFW